MHPQQSPPQLPDSGSAGLSSTRLQIVQYSGLLLFVIISLPKRPVLADSVEKVALLFGLGQNHSIGQRENTQHDGTVIEWAGAAVLLVQH